MRKKNRAHLDIVPPSGIFVRVPSGECYFIKGGRAYSITEIHLASWGVDVIPITATALLTVPVEGKLGFRDGTLIKDFGDGKMYLVSDSKRRLITDPAVFEALGGNRRLRTVPTEYIRLHEEGEAL